MINSFDTEKIAASFHQQAADYDNHISVQKRVVEHLARQVQARSGFRPGSVLDVGSGTGALLSRLQTVWPDASLYGVDLAYNMCLRTAARLGGEGRCHVVNADAEHLPFRDASFDLVVSTSALQWVGSLSNALHEMRRVMKPGGELCVAFFSVGTLYELRRCLLEAVESRCADRQHLTRLHQFRSDADLKQIINDMDFEKVVVSCETETDWHDDLPALLRSIKKIGAGAVAGDTGGGLGWRGIINETSRIYRECYGKNGKIPASYQVIYLQARLGS